MNGMSHSAAGVGAVAATVLCSVAAHMALLFWLSHRKHEDVQPRHSEEEWKRVLEMQSKAQDADQTEDCSLAAKSSTNNHMMGSTSGEIVALNFLAEIGSDDFTFKAFVECTPHVASLLKQDLVIAPFVKKHESSLEGRFFNRFHVDVAGVDAVRDRCIDLGYTWKNSV